MDVTRQEERQGREINNTCKLLWNNIYVSENYKLLQKYRLFFTLQVFLDLRFSSESLYKYNFSGHCFGNINSVKHS